LVPFALQTLLTIRALCVQVLIVSTSIIYCFKGTDLSRSGPSTSSQGAGGVSRAWKNLGSVTDQGDLDAFLQNAELAERTFAAEVCYI
jgi:hypothetical protein